MKKISEQSKEQDRWDQKGQELINEIQDNPEKFIVDESSYSPYETHQDFAESLELKIKR